MLFPEIVRVITEKHNLPQQVINEAIGRIFKNIADCLADGGRVEIRDFGIFSLRYRAGRIARNPKTGKRSVIPNKYVLHFKPGKWLRERVNQSATSYILTPD